MLITYQDKVQPVNGISISDKALHCHRSFELASASELILLGS